VPWTFAHPAAVVFLRRVRPLSFAGLVAGSMVPDIGYYVGRFDLASAAHTPLGLLTACLPTGLVLVALLRVGHRPIALLLPQPHRGALLSLPLAPVLTTPAAMVRVSLSVVLGAATHILWDSFTHESGYIVSHSALLRLPVFSMIGREYHLYNVLQHASTLLGVAILVLAYIRWLRVATERSSDQAAGHEAWRYILLALLAFVSLATAGFLTYQVSSDMTGAASVSRLLFRFVVDATAIFAVLLAASALLAGMTRFSSA
jgi:hypothetical protein